MPARDALGGLDVQLVRRAMRTDVFAGGLGAFEHDVVEATCQLSAVEQVRLIAKLAMVARGLAMKLPPADRELVLSMFEVTS